MDVSVLVVMDGSRGLTRGKIAQGRAAVDDVGEGFGVGGLVVLPAVGDHGVEGVVGGGVGVAGEARLGDWISWG
jgi:hypothetical protein